MIAEVVGAVQNPIPVLTTSSAEDGKSDEKCSAPAVSVADRPCGQQHAGERQDVTVHHPGELGLSGRRFTCEIGRRGVECDHRRDDQRHAEAGDHEQSDPARFGEGGEARVDILVGRDEGVDHGHHAPSAR
jgi:hypothetical protein